MNALGAWLERDIGLQEKEGQYVCQKPRMLSEISEELLKLTGIDQKNVLKRPEGF